MTPFTWSFSSWQTFERCKLTWYKQYVLKLPRTPPGAPAQRGIEMHKTIENHIKDGHPLTPELDRWSMAFSEIRAFPLFAEHKIAVNRNWEVVDWRDPSAWCRAVLDLKAILPNMLSVFDWKSGKEYAEHYDQKELYAILALAEHPEAYSCRAIHVYLDKKPGPGAQTRREYHRDSLPARRAAWAARAAKMEHYLNMEGSGHFIPEPNFSCRWCQWGQQNGNKSCRF